MSQGQEAQGTAGTRRICLAMLAVATLVLAAGVVTAWARWDRVTRSSVYGVVALALGLFAWWLILRKPFPRASAMHLWGTVLLLAGAALWLIVLLR